MKSNRPFGLWLGGKRGAGQPHSPEGCQAILNPGEVQRISRVKQHSDGSRCVRYKELKSQFSEEECETHVDALMTSVDVIAWQLQQG